MPIPGFEQQIQQYNPLEWLANKLVSGYLTGMHASPYQGFSVEFSEHRNYYPGESIKHIDWKLYARSDKLFVKKYEEETNLRAYILIDTTASMHFPAEKRNKQVTLEKMNKLQFSILATAVIAQLLRKQRDAVGLAFVSDRLEEFLPAKSSPYHFKLFYQKLLEQWNSNFDSKGGHVANLPDHLHYLAERIPKRSLVVVFSDLLDIYDNKESFFDALHHLHFQQNEVVIFHVMEKRHEINLDYPGNFYKFIDLEQKQEIKLNPHELQTEYKSAMQAFIHEIENRIIQYNGDYHPAFIDEGFDYIIRTYFNKRRKMRR
ncbi:MAG: hypothetical protein KatS3mg034_0953 [Vicingaceae bacterium]|nr:MAG: hypothetical protein KatS3mg028_1686 [Bacteroidia bacterium]GIV41643.1 MAG: hypothetical protein KatS3mg034_0953 [Vicingaceae bacterium]